MERTERKVMGFDTVKWFKLRAKELLKAQRSGDEKAKERIRAHVKNMNHMHLQKIQHVVAEECGFAGWKGMLDATEEQRINAIALVKASDGDA